MSSSLSLSLSFCRSGHFLYLKDKTYIRKEKTCIALKSDKFCIKSQYKSTTPTHPPIHTHPNTTPNTHVFHIFTFHISYFQTRPSALGMSDPIMDHCNWLFPGTTISMSSYPPYPGVGEVALCYIALVHHVHVHHIHHVPSTMSTSTFWAGHVLFSNCADFVLFLCSF